MTNKNWKSMLPVALLAHVGQTSFVPGNRSQLCPGLGKAERAGSLRCLARHPVFKGKQWRSQPRASVTKGSASASARQPSRSRTSSSLGSFGPTQGATRQQEFSPHLSNVSIPGTWGDYSNISHKLVYLESYVFCNFDLAILC